MEDFTYDPLSNWNHYKLTASLDQDRTHNTANQISTIEGSPSLLAHYPTGNMTTVTPAHHEYWDAAWRLIEERSGTATTPDFQYLYGLRHRNDLILRDAAPPSGDSSTSTSELLTSNSATADTSRLYVTYDWINPTAILARDGTILERQSFSAFGQCRLLAGNWAERATSELSDWNFSFHGQFKDKETGWANYGYRLLLPVLGGWPGRDPLQEFAGPNIYLFALNSPLVFNDLLGLEIYFAIYFLNPVSDPPKSFEKAANTWLDQQRWFRGREKQFGKKTGCDEYLAKGVTTREDFIKAWNEILASSDALEKKCHGSGKIAKGAWFGHSGFNSKTDEPEINLSKSDISIADIKGFAKLPWKDKATMTLFSCRSGIAGAGMTLAGEFAKAQNVTTIGQKGYTYFSSDPAQDVPIKPDDKKIYLGAFVRRRNFWYSWGYFAGHVLAPTEFNP